MAFALSFGGFGEVVAAFALFLVSHSLPSLPGVRRHLVAALGERPYLVLYSVIGLATLGWLVMATLDAPYVELWGHGGAARWVPILVMPFALVLLVAGATTRNPLSLGPSARGFNGTPRGILAVTRHPVLWAGALWSGAHLIANGDLRAVLLFGGLCLFSLAGMPLFDRRRARTLGAAEWARLAAATSAIPFAALLAGRARLSAGRALLWQVALGLVLYVVILHVHGDLFGVSPLGW